MQKRKNAVAYFIKIADFFDEPTSTETIQTGTN
jgi:hypothetical protein